MKRHQWLALVLIVSLPWAAHAQKLYKWVDKDGRVSYHDQPPSTDGYRVEEKSLKAPAAISSANRQAAEAAPVVMYMAPRCSSCDAARSYLQKRGIPFSEKNVQSDRSLQEELMKQTGGELSVPTILIGKKVMRGFLESLLEDELTEAGYSKSPEEGEEGSEPKEEVDAADADLAPTK